VGTSVYLQDELQAVLNAAAWLVYSRWTSEHTTPLLRELHWLRIPDSELTMSAQVSAVCRSGFFQLRQLRPVVRSLSTDATKTLVQAFISNRLDYCNSLLYGITDNLLRRVQAVQNAAVRLITGVRRHKRITPVLKQLHWLSVRQRVHFKTGCHGV